jgi:hypothetical protein
VRISAVAHDWGAAWAAGARTTSDETTTADAASAGQVFFIG